MSGYETRDAHAGATLRAGLYVLAAIFLVAAILVPAYRLLARRERSAQPRPATVVTAAPSPRSFPLLVTNEPLALADFRAQEDAVLGGYGWVEKDRGIARMPIDEALRIVGQRGALPSFAAPSPTPAAGRAAPGGTR